MKNERSNIKSSKKKHKDLCSQYEFGGGRPNFSCKEVYLLIIEFSS